MIFQKLKLPPYAGVHKYKRNDGIYGYICNACGYSVGDNDTYCSKCGARLSENTFYYDLERKINKKPKETTLHEVFAKYEAAVLAQYEDEQSSKNNMED